MEIKGKVHCFFEQSGASVGRKFSKRFALNKTAQKVDYNPAQTTAEPSDSDEPTVTPGGGDDPNSGND